MAEMTPERLAEIKQRADAATEGPWLVRTSNAQVVEAAALGKIAHPISTTAYSGRSDVEKHANAAFNAHAREDIPALLAAVADLRAKVEGLEAEVEAYRSDGAALSASARATKAEYDRDAALARARRLEEVVARLPKTADGVLVEIGMRVWTKADCSDDEPWEGWIVTGIGPEVYPQEGKPHYEWVSTNGNGYLTVGAVYSTPEAARAALAPPAAEGAAHEGQ